MSKIRAALASAATVAALAGGSLAATAPAEAATYKVSVVNYRVSTCPIIVSDGISGAKRVYPGGSYAAYPGRIYVRTESMTCTGHSDTGQYIDLHARVLTMNGTSIIGIDVR